MININYLKFYRFRQIPLHAADHLRPDLHGHGHRGNDTFVRASGGAMRPADGFHGEGVVNGVTDARSVSSEISN